MPTVENNKKQMSLKDALVKNNAQSYVSDMIVNVPESASKGASFQIGDSFRTPTYVSGAKDTYMNPINVEKGNMDYLAAFATDSIKKLQTVTKVLDPNGETGLIKPNTRYEKGVDTGELTGFSSNKLAGSVSIKGADGEEYRLNIQQKNISNEAQPYTPSKAEKELYGDMGNPSKPSKIHSFGAEISVAKKDKTTNEYGDNLGSITLWGQMDNKGNLVAKETNRQGAVVDNYFSLAKNHDVNSFKMISQLVKDGFSYTPEQREAEKANPELAPKIGNMQFRIMDKEVSQKVRDTFVKTAEEVTKGTNRTIENKAPEASKENSKSLFVSVTLDTKSEGLDEKGKKITKTGVILTPAVWTAKEHEVDYSKHIAKVDPQYGQKDLKELGSNLNKSVKEYNAAKEVEADKGVEKTQAKTVTKSKGKSKEADMATF